MSTRATCPSSVPVLRLDRSLGQGPERSAIRSMRGLKSELTNLSTRSSMCGGRYRRPPYPRVIMPHEMGRQSLLTNLVGNSVGNGRSVPRAHACTTLKWAVGLPQNLQLQTMYATALRCDHVPWYPIDCVRVWWTRGLRNRNYTSEIHSLYLPMSQCQRVCHAM